MKRLILFELIILFFATTFESDSPPGWFQQTLPVNDIVNDIFFIDTLNGWLITNGDNSGSDTAYIMYTGNGGTNWNIQFTITNELRALQFVNNLTGYISGGTGTGTARVFKTTDGGINWNIIFSSVSGNLFTDLFFVNAETGWVCDADNISGLGLQKTTDGGANWFQQLPTSYGPSKLFFLNKDTGWVSSNFSGGGSAKELYRTTNGGDNWNLQFTSEFAIESLFFLNSQKGWMRGGYIANTMGIALTTNGGFNWVNAQGEVGGFDIKFVTDSIGYSGMINNKITKSTDGGKTWGYQSSPVYSNLATFMFRGDTLLGWAGTTGIVKTTDGGGTIFTGIEQIGNELPTEYKLFQNYPNPFNPKTNIKYQITKNNSIVRLTVFDITGREVIRLVDKEQNAGIYLVDFNAAGYSSGVYFYGLLIGGVLAGVKSMILLK